MGVKYLDHIMNKICKKCDSLKPPASHHCSTCRRCIARMDHHCPWVNNCVGYYNQKHFLLFLVYVFLGSSHALVFIIVKGYGCLYDNCYLFDTITQIVLCIVSIFLGLLFAIFVCVMFYDQMEAVLSELSTIDQL